MAQRAFTLNFKLSDGTSAYTISYPVGYNATPTQVIAHIRSVGGVWGNVRPDADPSLAGGVWLNWEQIVSITVG